jgi:hypothetical protein
MNKRPLFLQSMSFLAQPASLFMLGLLVFNDHILRRWWPSWWSGKLGDFAWLYLCPVVLLALLGLLLPVRFSKTRNVLIWLAYLSSGLGFILFKLVPPVQWAVLQTWQAWFGFPAAAVIDPSDLLALLALGLSAWVWSRPHVFHTFQSIPLRAWLFLPLFALFTVADAAAPDYGLQCLRMQDNMLVVRSSFLAYSTQDGGLSWETVGKSGPSCEKAQTQEGDVINTAQAGVMLRFYPGKAIEKSLDGGTTWTVDYSFESLGEVEKSYYLKTRNGTVMLKAGPQDAYFDRTTGNVIFAMGHEGALVRMVDGAYRWVTVGPYQRLVFSPVDMFFRLLQGEMLLAFCLLMLLVNMWWAVRRRAVVRTIWMIVGWLMLGFIVIAFPPALMISYSESMAFMGILATGAVVGILFIYNLVDMFRNSLKSLLKMLLLSLLGAGLFLLPYGLWTAHIIPTYTTAMIFAIVLGLVCAGAGTLIFIREN